jgi:hypothetical protein
VRANTAIPFEGRGGGGKNSRGGHRFSEKDFETFWLTRKQYGVNFEKFFK